MEENDVNESANNLEVAEQEESVESTDTEVVDNAEEQEETTTENTEEDSQAETQEETKETQSKEDNKYARMARLQAQKEAEKKIEQVRKEAYEKGLEQGKVQSYIGKQNPYTNQTIKDDYDVQEYLEMYKLDSEGKDPINDYRELQKQKARDEAKKQIELDEKAKQEKWFEDDTKHFIEDYSQEKLQELMKDEDFNLFAKGKIGKVPLGDIYDDYEKLISKYEKKSVETAKQIIANNNATPGAIEEQEVQEMDWGNMSKDQFEKYLRKAKDGDLR